MIDYNCYGCRCDVIMPMVLSMHRILNTTGMLGKTLMMYRFTIGVFNIRRLVCYNLRAMVMSSTNRNTIRMHHRMCVPFRLSILLIYRITISIMVLLLQLVVSTMVISLLVCS